MLVVRAEWGGLLQISEQGSVEYSPKEPTFKKDDREMLLMDQLVP